MSISRVHIGAPGGIERYARMHEPSARYGQISIRNDASIADIGAGAYSCFQRYGIIDTENNVIDLNVLRESIGSNPDFAEMIAGNLVLRGRNQLSDFTFSNISKALHRIADEDSFISVYGVHHQSAVDAIHLLIDERNVAKWNLAKTSLEENGLAPDLSGADISYALLERIDLRGMRLSGINFSGTDLTLANLSAAILDRSLLNGARFGGAIMVDSILDGAYLESGTHLGGAILIRASFIGAHAKGAYFGGARLIRANFTDADLRKVIFIEADLDGAVLDGANIEGINRRGAVWPKKHTVRAKRENDLGSPTRDELIAIESGIIG